MPKEELIITDKPSAQRYEIIVLVANKYSDEEVVPIISAVTKLVRDNGGTIIAEENWGKRKLAYPIKHFFHASYHLIECDLPTAAVQTINNALRLNEHLLRHLLTQKRIKTEEEIKKERAAQERIAKEEVKTKADAARPADCGAKKPSDAPGENKMTEVDIAALDAKLDKILDDTNDLL